MLRTLFSFFLFPNVSIISYGLVFVERFSTLLEHSKHFILQARLPHSHTHSYKHIFLCLSGIEAKIHTHTNSDESTGSNSRFLHKNSLACRVEHPWIEPTTFRLVDNLLCGELIFHHGIIPTYERSDCLTASQTLTTYWCMDVNGWSFAQHNE